MWQGFFALIGDVLAVAWIGGTEYPFGFLDEPISGPVPVFSLEFRQLDVEATAVFKVVRWLTARLAAQLSGQGFQRQCQPGLTGGLPVPGLFCLSLAGLVTFTFQYPSQAEQGEQMTGYGLDGY